MPGKINTAKIILQILGWLNIVTAVVVLLLFLFGSIIIGVSGEDKAVLGGLIVGGVGIFVFVITAVMGVLYLLTARGIANRKNWAKIVGIILGVLMLPGIPVGTILGVFILIGLLSQEAPAWFVS